MTAIWAALDLTSFSTSVTAALVTMVGVSLLFMAYRYAKKVTSRG